MPRYLTEKNVYDAYISKGLGDIGHVMRVENSVMPGVPDVNYAVDDVEGWVELKIFKRRTVLYFEKFQMPWMRERIKHNPRVFVLAYRLDDDTLSLFRAKQILAVETREYSGKWILVDTAKVKPLLREKARKMRWNVVSQILSA